MYFVTLDESFSNDIKTKQNNDEDKKTKNEISKIEILEPLENLYSNFLSILFTYSVEHDGTQTLDIELQAIKIKEKN